MLVVAALKYTGVPKCSVEMQAFQDAFFHHCAALYGSFSSFPPTTTTPPPPLHYHKPLKNIARIELLFISAL